MDRLPRRSRPFTFDDLIRSDEHHDVFLNRDVPVLSDGELWAERKLREVELAGLIRRRDRSVITGSDILTGRHTPLTRTEWLRDRLRSLEAESQRRLIEWAS